MWPDPIDYIVIISLTIALVVAVVLGFGFMFFDLRAWHRAWRKALAIVRDYLPHIPAWAKYQTPGCLLSFGLRMPCTEADLLREYRKKVKHIHPDRGGDRKRFMKFQNDFEASLEFLRVSSSDQTFSNA